VQIVGYETASDSGGAGLFVATEMGLERIALEPGGEIAYTLGDRRCAGTIEDGSHDPCSRPDAPYCDRHTKRWACARCRGDCDRPLASCREEHAVYLAAFAPATFKIGVTRAWRVETRLREQGADRGAHLRTVADGRIARRIEADIASSVGDRVRVATKLRGLHRSVEASAWESLLEEYEHGDRYAFDYGFELGERPVAETLASGRILGTKGRILVLEREASTYAVDLRSLVGHEVTEGEPGRDLQSSLGAFE